MAKLCIVSNIDINQWSIFLFILMYLFLPLLPFSAFFCTNQNQGFDTAKLQHDVQTFIPKPTPVPSMWIEYNQRQNVSSFVPFSLWNEGLIEMLVLCFPWNQQIIHSFNILLKILLFVHRDVRRKLNGVIRHRKWSLICIYLAAVVLFSILLCTAMDGAIAIIYTFKDNFHDWIESNVVIFYLDEDLNEKTTFHPFTLGLNPPFYLKQSYRYLGEDVVFTCEYNVFGDKNVEPYHIETWWRKHGLPVEVSDRLYFNVSIEGINNDNPLVEDSRQYRIFSTLTIQVIQSDDYGTYTCDYINPIPKRVLVKPVVPQNNDQNVYMSIPRPEPMTPNPKCDCQPTFQQENKHSLVLNICFSEFELLSRAPTTKIIQMSPGGILINAAVYHTVVNIEEIKVDVTFEANSDREGNTECCSMFIKAYWALFRRGSFVDLPISRLMGIHVKNDTSQLALSKFTCICKQSFGLRRFIFYRDYYNSTIRREEEIEIVHPVEVKLEPQDKQPSPLYDGFSFCTDSETTLCWCIDKALNNYLYIVYTYDVFFIFAIYLMIIVAWQAMQFSSNFISKPLRRLCLGPSWQYACQFPAVEGPPITLRQRQQTRSSYQYDIYLSYSEEDAYDKEVAKHLKNLLMEEQLIVFDSVEDILPGRLEDYESAKAISSSDRFLVIASETYTDDDRKKMQFVAIQDTIVSQNTILEDRLLIIQVGVCDIVGLHRVPYIYIPENLKEMFSLDLSSANRFCQWIRTTGASDHELFSNKNYISKLHSSGFGLRSILFISLLLYLSMKSDILNAPTEDRNET